MRQENPLKTQSFDLILRGLEISSGSLRVHDPKILKANLERQGLNIESLDTGEESGVIQWLKIYAMALLIFLFLISGNRIFKVKRR